VKKVVAMLVMGMFVLAFGVVALPLFFVAANTRTSACGSPTDPSGTVALGTGPASEAYFNLPWLKRVEERKENARRIIEIGRQKNQSTYSIETAVSTALQESGLLNLPMGDRDSLGLFQQRPSQGWGTPSQIMDVTHSTSAFFAALDKIPNKDSLSHKDAAIAVQIPSISAYNRTWQWDDISRELVNGSAEQTCAQASGGAHQPLDEGYRVSYGGGFNDPNYPAVKPHKGIDFSGYAGGSLGKPVYAALPGTVVVSPIGRGCNGDNSLTIVHDEGFKMSYMHMNGDNVTVRVGDTVTAGQQIGAIGNCGHSTGAHLHFEVLPGTAKSEWINSVPSVNKFGLKFLDPVAVMAHYGVDITP
jgi:murein DD-endopeptidase MepM/ murein hydrolase activator NlpD